MKTPHLLLAALLLCAASAKAELKPGDRCDADWLTKTADAVTSGAVINYGDERIDSTGQRYQLKLGNPKTCDAATWRHLVNTDATPVWRNPAIGTWWTTNSALAQQTGLMLAVNEAYSLIDEKALAINAAADEVVEAAVGLGLAAGVVPEMDLAGLTRGNSGGRIGALKPVVVTVHEAGKQTEATVDREQVGATYRKLVNDAGGSMTPGSSILKFRKAVLALGIELDRLSKSVVLIRKHTSRSGNHETVLRDLPSGLPKDFTTVPAEDSNVIPDAKGASKYDGALTALVGTGPEPGLYDPAARANSALDGVDIGLRNLIIHRSAQVDKIFAATKTRLTGKSIASFEAAARMAKHRETLGAAPNSLAAATMDRLSRNADYAELDRLYEDRKKREGDAWVGSAAGQQAATDLDNMRKAAASATVENGKVVVMVNQRKRVLGNVPTNVEDAATRDYAAGQIADLIMRGARDEGKYEAIKAAIGGAGQPGKPMDDATRADMRSDLPAAPSTPPSAWDQAMKSKDASCGSVSDIGRSEASRIAARKAEAVGDRASANSAARDKRQADLNRTLEQLAQKCAEDEAKLKAKHYSPSIMPAAAERDRERLINELNIECNRQREAAIAKARTEALNAKELLPEEEKARAEAEMTAARADFVKIYDAGIDASLARLAAAYAKEGDAHRVALEAGGGFRGADFDKAWVDRYFKENWHDEPKRSANMKQCREAHGYKDDLNLTTQRLPNPDPDPNDAGERGVDVICGVYEIPAKEEGGAPTKVVGVRRGITAFFRSNIATQDIVVTPGETVRRQTGKVDLAEQMREEARRRAAAAQERK